MKLHIYSNCDFITPIPIQPLLRINFYITISSQKKKAEHSSHSAFHQISSEGLSCLLLPIYIIAIIRASMSKSSKKTDKSSKKLYKSCLSAVANGEGGAMTGFYPDFSGLARDYLKKGIPIGLFTLSGYKSWR